MQSVFDVMTPMLGAPPRPARGDLLHRCRGSQSSLQQSPTVILGPGEPQMAHQTDEYCVLDRIEQSVAAYQEIIRRWCLV